MKFRILFLLTLVVVGSQSSTAHARDCSNSTIRGSYAFTIHGTLFLPDGSTLVIDGIDKVTFDGKGNFTQVDAGCHKRETRRSGLAPWHGHLFGERGLHRNPDHCGSRACPTCICSLSSPNRGTRSTK